MKQESAPCWEEPIVPVLLLSYCQTSANALECMAGTTGLEPATSAVTGQRSDQLSYVPRLFFNNLGLCHIESSGSQLSLFSLSSTISLLWTQFRASVDTTWTPRWTPKSANPTTKFSVSDEPAIWCPPPRSQRLRSRYSFSWGVRPGEPVLLQELLRSAP